MTFGPYRLDLAARVLWHGDAVVPLRPKVMDVLIALVARGGDLVSKDDLIDTVWPDTVVEEANLGVTVSALRRALGEQPDGTPYIETHARRGYRFTAAISRPHDARRAVAVLPFARLSREADSDLGLAIADAVITRLARLDGLVVRPTSAVARYADAPVAAQQAARELRVEAALEGRLQRAGDRLRVTMQMVQASDGATVWSDTFDGNADDVFALQDLLAERVVQALQAPLGTMERARLVTPRPASLGAYEAYAQGRAIWLRFTPAALHTASAHFHDALARDPGYAQPWAALAQVYVVLGFSGLVAPSEAWELARDAARHALERDAKSAEAEIASAWVQLFAEWDWRGARAALDRALVHEPGSATVRHWRALFLDLTGNVPAARTEVEHSMELDPGSLIGFVLRTLQEMLAGDLAAELEHADAAVTRFPEHFLPRWSRGLALLRNGRAEAAVDDHHAAHRLAGGPLLTPVLARTLAAAGKREEAELLLRGLAAAGQPFASPYQRATVLLAQGDTEGALDALESAAEARDPWVVWIAIDPMLEPLRDEPRFHALSARIAPATRAR